ncbi:uncharacterized protein EAF02_007981 [Botrytis sinoallii]|uniref:uncharacterized protein n=1 Tax=Botrytis sinoallii TaxID=1463999 RepID=UPI0019022543|nr:uncharacterized protein EAF02_007981 [Botrytis sinoallii]KAF7879811.1 hypothetical protein EAF02_007981 [Botrytis sinoallii]
MVQHRHDQGFQVDSGLKGSHSQTAARTTQDPVSQLAISDSLYNSYLLAASGIVHCFSWYFLYSNAQLGQLYLAGLWTCNLPSDLCWWVKVIEDHCVPSRAKPYRAPTWSWASVDFEGKSPCSPVVYHSNFGEKFEQSAKFCIHHAATQMAPSAVGKYVYGPVCDGLIRIRCILIAAQIFTHPYLEFDARHTTQFLEADALDEDYDPYFWPNVYLDVQGSFEPAMSKPFPAANLLDLPIAGDLEDKGFLLSVDVVETRPKKIICAQIQKYGFVWWEILLTAEYAHLY